MPLALYDWAPSPFCHKVRAILAYKGLAYERLTITPERWAEIARRGGVGKVPALDIDGEMVVDSHEIARRIDKKHPEPPLIPSGAREAALCRALEGWADEAIYFNALHFHWRDPAGRTQTEAYFSSQGPGVAAMFAPMAERTAAQVVGHGTGRKSDARILADVSAQVETADALLADGPFLLGSTPWLCDFALMGQLVYLSRTPTVGATVTGAPHVARFLGAMRAVAR